MSASALTFNDIGTTSPTENLRFQYYEPPNLEPGQVLVQILAAPVNPQDLMVLLGKYPVKPAHKINGAMIPGYDGVGRIVSIHDNSVRGFQPGDLVIPKNHGLGTWRTHAVVSSEALLRLPPNADPQSASMFRMCFAPAYLLLEDMATLRPGDWIIQNAASGVIAQLVTQFARLRGLHTISVVRDRPDMTQLVEELQESGADIVLAESDLLASSTSELLKGKRVKLALDAVFGQSGSAMTAYLEPNGIFVNYGSLSRSATIQVTQSELFWKQITFKNFRLSESLAMRSAEEIADLFVWFSELGSKGLLRGPLVKKVNWNETSADIVTKQAEEQSRKAIFVFE